MNPAADESRSDGVPESAPEGRSSAALPEADAAASLRSELEETRDKLLRQAAEFQNFRKRTAQERETLVEVGKTVVLERMLEVLDDFERSVNAAVELEAQEDAGAPYQALKQGVELVYRKFVDELSRLGVEPVEAVGQPFDEHLHDAMLQQPAPEGTAPGTVLAEIQKGYRVGNRILRHSKVIVATEPQA